MVAYGIHTVMQAINSVGYQPSRARSSATLLLTVDSCAG